MLRALCIVCCYIPLLKISSSPSLVSADQSNEHRNVYLSPRVQVLHLCSLSAVGSTYEQSCIAVSKTKATQRMRYSESTPSIFVEALQELVDNTLGFSDEFGLFTSELNRPCVSYALLQQ